MLRASGASARLVIGAIRACSLLAFAQPFSLLPAQFSPVQYAPGSLVLELSIGPQLQTTHPGLLMPNLLNWFWIWLLSPETLVLRDNTYFLAVRFQSIDHGRTAANCNPSLFLRTLTAASCRNNSRSCYVGLHGQEVLLVNQCLFQTFLDFGLRCLWKFAFHFQHLRHPLGWLKMTQPVKGWLLVVRAPQASLVFGRWSRDW